MEQFEIDGQKPGVRWHTNDEEALETSRNPVMHTQISSSQLSIHNAHSRRGSIDPGTMLPIQYRTVSFNIDETKERDLKDAKKAKDSATTGMSSQSH